MIHTASRPLTVVGARGVLTKVYPPVVRFMIRNLPNGPVSDRLPSAPPTDTSVKISSPGLMVKLLIICSVGCCGRKPRLMFVASCSVPACTRSVVPSPSSPTHNAEYVLVPGSPVTKGTCQVPATQSYGSLKPMPPPIVGLSTGERRSSNPPQLEEVAGACCLPLPCVTSGFGTRCGSMR